MCDSPKELELDDFDDLVNQQQKNIKITTPKNRTRPKRVVKTFNKIFEAKYIKRSPTLVNKGNRKRKVKFGSIQRKRELAREAELELKAEKDMQPGEMYRQLSIEATNSFTRFDEEMTLGWDMAQLRFRYRYVPDIQISKIQVYKRSRNPRSPDLQDLQEIQILKRGPAELEMMTGSHERNTKKNSIVFRNPRAKVVVKTKRIVKKLEGTKLTELQSAFNNKRTNKNVIVNKTEQNKAKTKIDNLNKKKLII
eukprot:UN30436